MSKAPNKVTNTLMDRLGIIGWPVSHSRSPLIHNHWLNEMGLAGRYERCPIDPNADLKTALRDLAQGGFIGANVTVPHKENAFAAMDTLDAAAQSLGAVNTISFQDGQMHGSNTDGAGFIAGLDAVAPQHGWRNHPALVLGAGGAARAIIVALAAQGVPRIHLVNRTKQRAEALGTLAPQLHIGDWAARAALAKGCYLLVNTTSLGMQGAPPLDMPLDYLPPQALVSDIVYTPLETDLLARARLAGLQTVDGLGMLLHQAALAFEIWLGQKPPVTAQLRQLLLDDLAG